MTQVLILLTILTVTTGEFLVDSLGLPKLVKFVPELLTVIVAFAVVVIGARTRLSDIPSKYLIAFGFVTFTILSGILINQVGSGPTIAGMRYYLRAIPFFFLPAVISFNESQIRLQLKVLCAIALAQIPLATYQRWIVMSEGRWTGDEVVGTLQISSILSIFLICCVLIVVGFALRGRMRWGKAVGLSSILLFPTMINETKGTLLILPIGLMVVILLGVPTGRRLRSLLGSMALFFCFVAIFVPVYDFTMKNAGWDQSLTDFLTDSRVFTDYIEKDGAGLGTADEVGRLDAIRLSYSFLSRDPVGLIFGLGLGNASHSALGRNFIGEYQNVFHQITMMSATTFLLEIGILGTALVFLLYLLLFSDAKRVAVEGEGLCADLACGWTGVITVFMIATFYKNIHTFESLSYLFWYFSGLLVFRRAQESRFAASDRATDSTQPRTTVTGAA